MTGLPLRSIRGNRLPPLPRNSEPLVIAHRGASSDVAEHTLPAYLEAIERGADGLECDVRLTRDGHLVCVHDRTLHRTSNGRGAVSEWDLAELQALDFGSWKKDRNFETEQDFETEHDSEHSAGSAGDPDWPESADELVARSPYLAGVEPDRLDPNSSQVLTLEALLGVVNDAGRPLKLLVETKHPTRYGGLVEKELVRTLRRHGFGRSKPIANGSEVTVMSFAPVALRRVRLLSPSLPLVLLLERWSPLRREGALPTGVETAGPGIHLLRADPGYVERAHSLGHRVYCWTVDDGDDVRRMSDLGVDAVITNRPATVARQLSELSDRGDRPM